MERVRGVMLFFFSFLFLFSFLFARRRSIGMQTVCSILRTGSAVHVSADGMMLWVLSVLSIFSG